MLLGRPTINKSAWTFVTPLNLSKLSLVRYLCSLLTNERATKSLPSYPFQTLLELSPLLHNMGNRESIHMTAAQALQELEFIVQSIPASRMLAPLN